MMSAVFLVVVEGELEVSAAARLLDEAGVSCLHREPIVTGGSEAFWMNASRYNEAAKHFGYVLGLTDLDDNPCAPELIRRHLGNRRCPSFLLRIQVRELESWLLADRKGIAEYFAVPESKVPREPEALSDPKQALVNLARHCRKRRIREEIVPEAGRSGPVGPGYTTIMTEFIEEHWIPRRGAERSPSLRKALRALESVRISPRT